MPKEKINWNKYKEKYEYVCSECGSGNVLEPTWVYANQQIIGSRVEGVDFDLCEDCNAQMGIITIDEFKERRK